MKKGIKIAVIMLLGMSCFLTVSGCSKYKEPAPFFDGLFLAYDFGNPNSVNKYTVENLNNGNFKITEREPRGGPLKDNIKENLVDVYSRVYKSSFKASEGRFSIIWIPVHKMEIGDTFDKSIVLKRDRWKKWEVLVIKPNNLPMQKYYEVNTGFLVSIRYSGILARGGIGELVLRDTNADIPVN